MKIGILTGGGDCPGMNAFVRAVTRSAINLGGSDMEVWGVLDGWLGLIEGTSRRIGILDTAGISNLGGTILGTVRVPQLRDNDEMKHRVLENFLKEEFDALVVCGGNGSLFATHELNRMLREREQHAQLLFTPASIDNDVANTYGTSIGFYSAVTRSVEMMDWIRDTASAHRRVYIIGSMGRNSAFLPFYAGLVAGVEYVVRPDEHVDFEAMADMIEQRDRDTRILVSENYPRSLDEIRAILGEALNRRRSRHEIRTVDMGYFQRGGKAVVPDVLRANWLGYHMVQSLLNREGSAFFGAFHVGAPPTRVSLEDAVDPSANHDDIPREMIEMTISLR